MFSETWKWAGRYRTTEKNLGVPVHQIHEQLAVLLGDARYWFTHQTFSTDESAIRFHHRLVLIHPFPNGNGRHARLMADLLAVRHNRPTFSWGGRELAAGQARHEYLRALCLADKNDYAALFRFSRS